MKEADFQTKFSRWARHFLTQTAVWELKLARGPLPFSAVKEHQERALLLASQTCIHYKIPDVGMAQKPFDGMTICKSPAYVVIQYEKRGNKEFFLIPIDVWVKEKYQSVRRSLTEERCREIGLACSFV